MGHGLGVGGCLVIDDEERGDEGARSGMVEERKMTPGCLMKATVKLWNGIMRFADRPWSSHGAAQFAHQATQFANQAPVAMPSSQIKLLKLPWRCPIRPSSF